MLKKKNIAMVMAAATVATSVAPVFAAEVEDKHVDEATLITEVEKMLNTKYSDSKETGLTGVTIASKADEYKNSVYQIQGLGSDIKSVEDLKVAIATAKRDNKELKLTVKDKGHKEINGRIVAVENNKNLVYAEAQEANKKEVLPVALETVNAIIGTVTNDAAKNISTIKLTSGVEIKVGLGDYVLDLSKPVDANGNLIDKTTDDVATGKKVVGFKLKESTTAFEKDIPGKDLDNLVFNGVITPELKFKLSDLVVEADAVPANGVYTNEGKALIELLGDANGDDSNTPATAKVVKNGKEYQVKFIKGDDLDSVKVSKDGGYELTIGLEVVEKAEDFAPAHKVNQKIVIKSDVQADLVALRTAIGVAQTDTIVKTSKYPTLAGDDRFETAVEISKSTYQNQTGAVVLVGENAIVDGLAAAPLAAEKTAPILLTKKDVVPTSTMNEIKRVVPKGSTVYLVGGENTISKEVEAQLIKEMNAKIVRLAGDDRYDTSLKIAKKLNTPVSQAFVVGGEGLADAMSVAAVAAKAQAPIIVSPANGLTKDAKDFLYTNRNVASFDVDVVGGFTKVSDKVIKDIEENTNLTEVERVSGTDRNDTNAKVIAKYFATSKLATIYVAKDGDAQLVDALAAAPLAGKTAKGAIVLATNNLTKSQENAVKATLDVNGKTLSQIGNGIASKVMNALGDLIK